MGGAYVLRGDTRGGTATLALFRLRPDGTIAPGWPGSGVVLGTLPQMSPEPLLRATASGACRLRPALDARRARAVSWGMTGG